MQQAAAVKSSEHFADGEQVSVSVVLKLIILIYTRPTCFTTTNTADPSKCSEIFKLMCAFISKLTGV